MTALAHSLLSEYGFDVTTPSGARRWENTVSGPQKIQSPSHYVGACRRLAERNGVSLPPDGRLIAAGWNRVSPRRWVCEGVLDQFLLYWGACVERPMTVGSSHNLVDPDRAIQAWQARIPAHLVRLLGQACAQRQATESSYVHQYRPLGRRLLTKLRHAARAATRTVSKSYHLPTKTLAVLGRLSPELHRAALKGVPRDVNLRVRDLNWEEVARVQKAIASDPSGRVKVAYAVGRRQADLLGEGSKGDPAWFCPAFPFLRLTLASRVVKGETPQDIATYPIEVWRQDVTHQAAPLTRAEAHEWLQAEAPSETLAWWAARYLPALPLAQQQTLRSWPVARWLQAVFQRGQWSSLLLPRTERHNGNDVTYTFLSRLDEVQEEDLVAGEKTGVQRAFAHCRARYGAHWLEASLADHRTLCRLPDGWRPFSNSMRFLNTRSLLAQEGATMGHCVGGYDGAVERGESLIFSIQVRQDRSTLELSRSGQVRQHRGLHNSEAPFFCQKVVDAFFRRLPRSSNV